MFEISRDVLFSEKEASVGRSTTSQGICRIENQCIYREPMLVLDQLLTLAQFVLKSVNGHLEEPTVTSDW